MTNQAIDRLKEGFKIDKKLKNRNGLGIVTPILCRTMQTVGKKDEAIIICKEAIKIAPRNTNLIKLQKELAISSSNSTNEYLTINGVIKRVRQKEAGFRYGFIKPDDGGDDIYFGETQLTKELLLKLKEGIRVVAEIEIVAQRPRAKRVWINQDHTTI